MGMTIEEAISHLDTYSSTMGSGQTTQAQHEEAKKVAIDTISECKKIIEAWKADTLTDGVSYDCMVKISEVVEDRNDD